MTFEDAVKERIRKYYDPNHDEDSIELNSVTPNKYSRKYFDDFEEEVLTKRNAERAKKK